MALFYNPLPATRTGCSPSERIRASAVQHLAQAVKAVIHPFLHHRVEPDPMMRVVEEVVERILPMARGPLFVPQSNPADVFESQASQVLQLAGVEDSEILDERVRAPADSLKLGVPLRQQPIAWERAQRHEDRHVSTHLGGSEALQRQCA